MIFAPEGQFTEESIQTAACRCSGTSLCHVQGNLYINDLIIIMVIFKRLSLKALSTLQKHEGVGGTG